MQKTSTIIETIIIQTEGSKLRLLKQLLKELGIPFKSYKSGKCPYDQEFVKKIKKAASEPSKPVNVASLWEDIK